jgi:hypothetical protein
MSREEQRVIVLEAWPAAVFMPWDEAPVGTAVIMPDEKKTTGRIAGVFRSPTEPVHECPSCACPRRLTQAGLDGWWIIDLDTPIRVGYPGDVERWARQALHYPPSLQPVAP